jgi:hypothetical protein
LLSKGIAFFSVLTVALGLAALLGGNSQAASAGPVTLTGYQQMAVDDVGGNSYIFLSQGAGGNGIAVTDLSGNTITTLDTGDGVEGLALSADGSTLYAAVASGTDAGKVAVITVSSITPTTTTPDQTFDALGTGDIPYSLAIQTGKLWVSYASNGGGAGTGAIGDIDLTSGTFESDSVGGTWYSAPDLAGDPQDGGTLVAVQPGIEPATAATYSTTNGTLATLAPPAFLGGSSNECDFEHQIAVIPGGQQFIAACGGLSGFYAYSAQTLAADQPEFSTGIYPGGVAVNTDGTIAVGTYGPQTAAYVYNADGTLLNVFHLGNGNPELVATNGLAWENTANGPALVAVIQSDGFSVKVFGQATVTQSALTLSGPPTALIGKPVTLTGSLTLSDGAALPANTQVTVTRTGPGSTTATTLPPVQPGSNGSFTVTDTPPAATGTYTYTASYSGDPSVTTAATATAQVTVNLNTATLSLSGPSSVSIGKSVALSGSLTLGNGVQLPSGTTVTVTRTGPGSTGSKTFTVTPTSSGSFTLTDTPSATGAYSYKAQYAGNATTAAATASHAVTVNPLATSLSITTGATTFNYRSTIHVTAHLGTTYTNRTVSIYAQWDGYRGKALLKTGRVNSHGELTVSYTAPHSTTFSVVFTGDAHYAARTVSHDVGIRASVAESIGGYYTSTHYGSTLYRVYHHTADLRESVAVTPNKSGECVKVEVQIYYQGKWYADLTTSCGDLNSASKISGLFSLSQATGYRYRIRADYVRSSKDISNLSNDSGWLYFVVVK